MTNIDLGLAGKVVLVTGGVRGVGAGISTVFREAGAVVVTCARRPADEGSDVADLEFHSVDLRDAEAVRAMIDGIVADHGRLDVVVNNAGGAPFALAAEASANFHAKIVALNLLSALTVAQEANRVMQPTGGAIINISSVSGHRPSPGTASYGAAKAGVDSLTQSLAVEWAPAVRINSVVVGPVKTELAEMHYGDSDGVAAVDATIPMGRMADPRDVGQAAAFLASSLAAYITGAELLVHGGGEKPAFLSASTADNKH
ncbi:NAD(P)-dependent dehydrogenase, short-chain alcohol dehydrogenase family [Dietzia kunjamensis subsp. schimae]|uniref:NAD(P)-dependent dehydrogenase, short-chain alcohol dehydrogenase family n=1 Tax=Dietzia kunjamensis subsp. schimae TaxID=498198 RepID=A0ABY1N0V7_9ACTN|nr:SDR family oxidoreductase [Dietzia kunjamensis]MBB1014820.1 SDR family oxidoreductase [Dietzia kunjamensis subsp. schimae]SMO51890.1 NAD(P)-dependent dehydrogenase, short-chain alcohol dehydrogenase family [Dietzia kunjamensis subsp. schimae]